MKKAVLLCLFACLLGAVFAGAETEEATPFFWPDITGKVLFSMTEPELGALKGFEEEAYISTSHFDDLAYEITATVFDDASQSSETARYMARISYKTGQADTPHQSGIASDGGHERQRLRPGLSFRFRLAQGAVRGACPQQPDRHLRAVCA